MESKCSYVPALLECDRDQSKWDIDDTIVTDDELASILVFMLGFCNLLQPIVQVLAKVYLSHMPSHTADHATKIHFIISLLKVV